MNQITMNGWPTPSTASLTFQGKSLFWMKREYVAIPPSFRNTPGVHARARCAQAQQCLINKTLHADFISSVVDQRIPLDHLLACLRLMTKPRFTKTLFETTFVCVVQRK